MRIRQTASLATRFALALALAVPALFGPTAADAGERVSQPKTRAGIAAVNEGDFSRAHALFRSQAARGDSEAQFELGMLYALGKGVPKDLVAAWMWTEIAARQNEPYADFIRDEVAANMSPVDIEVARGRANDWMRTNTFRGQLPVAKLPR
jgi:TPR repeat protein